MNQLPGIEGQKAPEFGVTRWVNPEGEESEAVTLESMQGKLKLIYCFQS